MRNLLRKWFGSKDDEPTSDIRELRPSPSGTQPEDPSVGETTPQEPAPEANAAAASAVNDSAEANLDALRRRAEEGDAAAQVQLGRAYDEGVGVDADSDEAMRWYGEAAERGDADGQYEYGQMFFDPDGRNDPDPERAFKWVQRAADQDHTSAQLLLGQMYGEGLGVPQDEAAGARWVRKSADQGLAEAQSVLGVLHAEGKGVAQDYAAAMQWYERAAAQGYANAQYNIGKVYSLGHGVPQNHREAVRWFRLAAAQDYGPAQGDLGLKYHFGQGVDRDDVEAVRLFELAAAKGIANAQNSLGNCHLNGHGVPQNGGEAYRCFHLAAMQGNEQAQFNLGLGCLIGKDWPRDVTQAERWMRASAQQGYMKAQETLGKMYFNGDGVPKDPHQAAEWMKKAAAQGYDSAQKELAMYYLEGVGVPTDAERAVQLLLEAGFDPSSMLEQFAAAGRDDAVRALRVRGVGGSGSARPAPAVPGYRDSETGLVLPGRVGAWTAGSELRVFGGPNGCALAYDHAQDMSATVYLYSAGMSHIPAGCSSPAVRRHFMDLQGEVQQAARHGQYRLLSDFSTSTRTSAPGTADELEWLVCQFDVQMNRMEQHSFIYLSAHRGTFVKVRFTYSMHTRVDRIAGREIGELLDALAQL